jgi:hypothetical protein
MLTARIIKKAPAELVKCTVTTVIAQKAHKPTGLTCKELQQCINDQCRTAGEPPAFELPEREVDPLQAAQPIEGPHKWCICQNFGQLNKVTKIIPMPQGDLLGKQQRLSSYRYISIFNFTSGFYAIQVPDKWRPYLAFYMESRGYFGIRECRWE